MRQMTGRVVGEQIVDPQRGGVAVDADGLDPEHLEPADVGQGIPDRRHLPVEDRADLAADEREVAWLGVAVHQRHPRARLGLAVEQRLVQPFQREQGFALDPIQFGRPAAELAIEVVGAVIERGNARLIEVDRVDRHE